jgi:hypothetical protein
MSATGIVNGTQYLLYIGYSLVVFGTANSFNVEVDTKDISARETNNWKKILPTTRKWSMEFEGKLAYTRPDGSPVPGSKLNDIITNFYIGQNKNFIMLKSNQLGASYWGGFAYLSSISIEAPNEDNTTFNLSFTGTNELIQS